MKLAILGSTGSIGTQALEIIDQQKIQVTVLSCHKNIELLIIQYYRFKPNYLVVEDYNAYLKIKALLQRETVEILYGLEGLVEVATLADYDVLLTSVVGAVGLRPTIAAVKRSKRIALANKETLVVYGEEIMALSRTTGAEIIPVDSEHSAIFQSLQGNTTESIEKIILTASGGPFLNKKSIELEHVKAKDALKHPNWSMGAKITIDSATLMNKGLEVIEAMWLFDMKPSQIDVVVHPQSIIHSLVQYVDGSVMAQLGLPDMKLPIHYALHYPQRMTTCLPRMDLVKVAQMSFYSPDRETFPCLDLAYHVLELKGTAPCILNAANEILVSRFLSDEIGFYDIPRGIEKALSYFDVTPIESLDHILYVDDITRSFSKQLKF